MRSDYQAETRTTRCIKSCILHGALDVDNFGDILLGRIFSRWLREAGVKVFAPSAAAQVAPQIEAVRECGGEFSPDAFLYIGGGYFGEPGGSVWTRWRWARKMARKHFLPGYKALVRHKPLGIIGVECGPISNVLARWAGIPLWNRAEVLCVRNEASRQYLQRWGIKRSVDVVADAALSLYGQQLAPDSLRVMEQSRYKAKKPVVSVHLTNKLMESRHGQTIWSIVRNWERSVDAHIMLIADQRNTLNAEATVDYYRAVRANFKDCSIHPYLGVDNLTGLLSASDLIITNKLHVGIVGAALRRAVIALPNHPKTARFYTQIGRPECCLPVHQWSDISLSNHFDRCLQWIGKDYDLPTGVINAAAMNRQKVEAFVRRALI